MKVAVLAAMPAEMDIIRETGLERAGMELLFVRTGIGKANAARSATELILNRRPDCIIGSGCAGSLGSGIRFMDTAVSERTAYHDVWCGEPNLPGQVQESPMYFESDASLLAVAHAAAAKSGLPVHFGLAASGDQFYISPQEDARILKVLPGAISADMESGAIAQTCHHYGVPYIGIRAISDTHGSPEEQSSTYADFWTEVRLRGFAFLKAFIDELSKT